MVAAQLSYAPGTGLVLAVDGVAMLLVDNTDDELVERLWGSMREGATFDTLAEVLADYGLRRLPSLGLAALSDEGIRLLVRGAVTARVGAEPGAVVIGAEATVTWQERSIAGAVEVVLTTGGVPSGALPLIGGAVGASAARLFRPDASVESSVQPAPAQVVLPSAALEPVVPEPVLPEPVLPDQAPEPEREPEPAADLEHEAPAYTMAAPDPEAPTEPRPEPEPDPQPEPDLPMHTMVAPEPDDDYDHMFGATRHASVEAAAVRPADPEDEEPPVATPAAPLPAPVAERPAVRPPSERALPVVAPGLIDAVPGSFAAPDRPVPPVAEASPVGDHDGMTMSRDQILQLKGAGPAPAPPVDPQQVLAVTCPHGHLNPPHAQRCRVCQEAIALQTARAVRRPSLGWLRFSNGVEVALDRPVIVGRQPSAERVAAGGDLPQLVTLDSPSQDISRRHVEVQLEGWHVLVRDLGSTNGTVVTLPGRNPERLHSGESLPITPGTVVSVADETTFSYEVTR